MKNSIPFLFDSFELTVVDSPPKPTEDQQNEGDGERNQQKKNVHQAGLPGKGRARRAAFSTTSNELRAMPNPASQAGNRPTSASGMQTRL